MRDLDDERLTIWLVGPAAAREAVVRERSVRLSRGGNKPLVSSEWLSSSSSGVGRWPLIGSVDWGYKEQISSCDAADRLANIPAEQQGVWRAATFAVLHLQSL